MCVQGRFCLQRKPRQANPQPFPCPLTGGLGLIKLLSKTRRDEFPSFHLPCHPFNSTESGSFLFSYVKMQRGELGSRGMCGEGGKVEEEEEEAMACGLCCWGAASQAQTKEQTPSRREVSRKVWVWVSEQRLGSFSWGILRFLFNAAFCNQTGEKCEVKKKISMYISAYLCTFSEWSFLLPLHLPRLSSDKQEGLGN